MWVLQLEFKELRRQFGDTVDPKGDDGLEQT